MKRFLTCTLCFVSLPVFADVTLYYDENGVCPYLQIAPNCTGDPVTQLLVTTKPDRDTGYYVNGNQIVDFAGNVLTNAVETLRNANLGSSATVPQNTTCMSGATLNNNGACVRDDTSYVQIDPNTGITIDVDDFLYDFEGAREFALDKDTVSDSGKSGGAQQRYYEFDVVFHWCPPPYGSFSWTWHDGAPASAGSAPIPAWDGILNTACNRASTTLKYKWPDYTYTNENGTVVHTGTHPDLSGQGGTNYAAPGTAGYYLNGQKVYCINIKTGDFITNENDCRFGTWDGSYYTPGSDTHNYLVGGTNGINSADKWVFRGFFILPEIGNPPAGCPAGTDYGDVDTNTTTAASNCIAYWANRNTLAKRYVTNKTERSARARLSATANHPYIIDITDIAPNHDNVNDPVHNGNIYSYWNTRWGILSETPIDPNYKVHLYGGWARMCETTEDSHCSLYIGYGANTGAMDNIGTNNFWWARDGSATYTTSCNSGTPQVALSDSYLETGTPSDGTYYPICKSQGNRNLAYNGNDATCRISNPNGNGTGRPGWSCTPGSNYSLSNAAVEVTCGQGGADYMGYEAKGWVIDKVTKRGSVDVHTSVWHPFEGSITCNNEYLGIDSPVKISVSVCEKCEPSMPHVADCGSTNRYGCREIICEDGYRLEKTGLDSNGFAKIECVENTRR